MTNLKIQQLSTEIIAEQEKQIQHLQMIILITIIICGLFVLALCILILKRMETKSGQHKRLPPPQRRSHNWEIRINEN
jgi:uncharacterized Tic20 family protein